MSMISTEQKLRYFNGVNEACIQARKALQTTADSAVELGKKCRYPKLDNIINLFGDLSVALGNVTVDFQKKLFDEAEGYVKSDVASDALKDGMRKVMDADAKGFEVEKITSSGVDENYDQKVDGPVLSDILVSSSKIRYEFMQELSQQFKQNGTEDIADMIRTQSKIAEDCCNDFNHAIKANKEVLEELGVKLDKLEEAMNAISRTKGVEIDTRAGLDI